MKRIEGKNANKSGWKFMGAVDGMVKVYFMNV